ncbi:hypothetical protein P9112_008613 [Eukaryota sp. TZLM1-RC]
MDFFIGDEALKMARTYELDYPLKHGQIENWDMMEKYWHSCMFDYLRCNPEEHNFLLTEPPLNSPENREYTAEVMFETFGVAGLYIGVQAVLALYGNLNPEEKVPITGTIIDSGDGVTHIIPIVEGYVVGSAIKHIPLAGRDITQFIAKMLRHREKSIPPHEVNAMASYAKERHSYVCGDLAKEFNKFDDRPADKIKQLTGIDSASGKQFEFDLGYERFLGPELFFRPEIFSTQFTTPLHELLDQSIQASPIDARRALYGKICLSGGSTMFPKFDKRLQRDLAGIVNQRMSDIRKRSTQHVEDITVNVETSPFQRFAVWYGGSKMASTPEFKHHVYTKADYEEHGPKRFYSVL